MLGKGAGMALIAAAIVLTGGFSLGIVMPAHADSVAALTVTPAGQCTYW
jgi:hypothetical protein